MKIFSSIRKYLHFPFQIYSNCICMPIIVSEFCPNKSSILSIVLCNLQFYPNYVRWKYSILHENVSSPIFNNTLFVFVCLSLYLSFRFPKYLQFYKLSYVILNFNVHMLDENLQYISKYLYFFFQLHSNCACKPIIVSVKITFHCIWDFIKKSSILSIFLLSSILSYIS